MSDNEIGELVGKVLTKITNNTDELIFDCADGSQYKLYHSQDCCESVGIEDIEGELSDLIGNPILQAEKVSDADFETNFKFEYQPESHTWTFYKLATGKGYVTVRWLGTSNGYYSESVEFCKL